MKPLARLLSPVLLALLAFPARGGDAVAVGDYVVHYAAVATTDLAAEAARRYGIPREAGRAMVSVVVNTRGAAGEERPATAEVSGTAHNQIQQRVALDFAEVADNGTTYHVALFPYDHGDILSFTLSVTPAGQDRPVAIRFTHRFFVD